jgi:hypothetical protein
MYSSIYLYVIQTLRDQMENRELEYKKCENIYAQREEQHLDRIEVDMLEYILPLFYLPNDSHIYKTFQLLSKINITNLYLRLK